MRPYKLVVRNIMLRLTLLPDGPEAADVFPRLLCTVIVKFGLLWGGSPEIFRAMINCWLLLSLITLTVQSNSNLLNTLNNPKSVKTEK